MPKIILTSAQDYDPVPEYFDYSLSKPVAKESIVTVFSQFGII